MNVVVVYARLYAACFAEALAVILKNAWTLLLPMGLGAGWMLVGAVVGGWGMGGGLILSLLRTAAASAYWYFVAQLVGKQRVGLADLKGSVGPYFWSWINLFFALWIVDLILGRGLAVHPKREQIFLALLFVKLVALNAVPETIALKGSSGGIETIVRAFKFLEENWIEWFIPNLLLLGGVWLLLTQASLPLTGLTVLGLVSGILGHVFFVFRGFLFQALDGSTHRQRMFRFKNGGSLR